MANVVRKITIKTCGLDKETIQGAVADVKGTVPLLRIAGMVSSGKPGQTDKGEYLKLIGNFHATNLLTGEVFDAANAILPSFISDQFAGVLQQAGNVEFALEIGAYADKSAVTGYVFSVRSLVESAPDERMQRLIAAVTSDAPKPAALPAPRAKKSRAKK